MDERGGGAGLLVQAVDVLGDQAGQPALAFEVDQGEVARVRLGGPRRRGQAELPGLDPDRAGGDVLVDVEHRLRGRVLRPQPLRAAEVGDPGRGGDPGPGQYGDGSASITRPSVTHFQSGASTAITIASTHSPSQ